MPLLSFEQVTLRRGGRLLFEGLNIEVGAGERLHVTGPNGSGKTSLIRLAAGLLRAERGWVRRSELALADDRPALDRELCLNEALRFWLMRPAERERLAWALAALDLAALGTVPVRLLSAGQLKRATIARVAAQNAPLWLLDEPLNGLDARGVESLRRLLDAHVDAGGAVVAASHVPFAGEWRRLPLDS